MGRRHWRLFQQVFPDKFCVLRLGMAARHTWTALGLPGKVIVSALEEARSPLLAALFKAQKIRNFFPRGGAARFIAIIPSRRGLTKSTSCLPKPRVFWRTVVT